MKIHAVLIGVDVYHDAGITNLLCATSDAHAFKHRLEQLGAVVRLIPAAQLRVEPELQLPYKRRILRWRRIF